jgi:hypothetical protein
MSEDRLSCSALLSTMPADPARRPSSLSPTNTSPEPDRVQMRQRDFIRLLDGTGWFA